MGKHLKWTLLSLLMRTLGRASDGIRLGYRFGFESGEMLDYVYRNEAKGGLLFGTFVDRMYLNAVGWRANRERKALLKGLLRIEIPTHLKERGQATVAGCGVGARGRYLQEVVEDLGRPQGLAIICRDLDAAGLALGREMAAAAGLSNFRFEVGDASDPKSLVEVSPRPDIVVASGLYELLRPELIVRSMNGIYQGMDEGGRFVYHCF